jgi:hypothetical protein
MRHEHSHARTRVIPYRLRRDPNRFVACSICLRVRKGQDWIEAVEVIRQLRTYEDENVVRLRGTLCERCEMELRLRRQPSVEELAA